MRRYFTIIIIVLIFILTGCREEKEEFVPERIETEHSFFNDGFISFIKLSTNLELENQVIIPKYSITSFMHITKGVNRKILYFQADWITSDNTYDIYYRNEVGEQIPVRFIAQEFFPFNKVNGNSINTFKAYYKYQSTSNGVQEIKEVKYQEDVLKFKESDFTSNSNTNNLFYFNIYRDDFNDGNYRFKFQINYKIKTEPIHLDMQSWIKTKDNKIYPLMGLYNYATLSEDYLSVSDEVVDKIVEIEKIYTKVVYIYNDQTHIITNIFNVNDLEPLNL